MSFILDALKKSENERQKQTGPALFEVKVAAPKPSLPLWAVALAVLLVVNIGVVIWLVLRKPPSPRRCNPPGPCPSRPLHCRRLRWPPSKPLQRKAKPRRPNRSTAPKTKPSP